MTREEAIKILKAISVYECYPKSASEETKEALDMAIEALTDRPQGEWEMCEDEDGIYGVCSVCGNDADFSHYGEPYDFCPICGAEMRGGDSE